MVYVENEDISPGGWVDGWVLRTNHNVEYTIPIPISRETLAILYIIEITLLAIIMSITIIFV